MNFSRLKNRLKKTGFFIPFTLYFFVFTLITILAWNWLTNKPIEADTAYAEIFQLLLTVAAWFAAILLIIALLSVLLSFFYYIYQKRKHGISFRLSTDMQASELNEKQIVRLHIRPILKPLFGYLKIRLVYDDEQYSAKFSLIEKSHLFAFSKTIEGTYQWPLPQIKEYHVQNAILYFEDVFQFFSFTVMLPAASRFFTQPSAKNIKDLRSLPRKTEETNTRIEELRKVEGEYLNYKNFENNDDVRRIVWKIYAKNKELVVRIPEIMDPYASHVYLYPSFFSNYSFGENTAVQIPFLNYFKILTWTIYENLVKQGFEVKYVTDQDVQATDIASEHQGVKYKISVSKWHRDKDLRSFVKSKDASIVIVSSLSDADQVQEFIEQFGKDITFIFIKLTDSLKKQNMLQWMQWLFVQKEKSDMDVYKTNWTFSTLRPTIIKNEKRLESILEKYQEAGVEI